MPSASKLTIVALSLLAKTAMALPLTQTSDLEVFVNAMVDVTTGGAFSTCDAATAHLTASVSATVTGSARAQAFNSWAAGYCFKAYHDAETCAEISAYLAATYYAYTSGWAGGDLFASLGGERVAKWHTLLTTLCSSPGCPSGMCDAMNSQWNGYATAGASINLSAVTHETARLNSLGLLGLMDSPNSSGLLSNLGLGGLGVGLKRSVNVAGSASGDFITYDSAHTPLGGVNFYGAGQADASGSAHVARDISALAGVAAQGAGAVSLGKGGLNAAAAGSASTFDSIKLGGDKVDVGAYARGSAYIHAAGDISAFSNTAAQGAGSLSLGKGGLDTSLKGTASTFDSLKLRQDKIDVGAYAQGSASIHASKDISASSNTAAQGAGSISLGKGGLDTSLAGTASTFDAIQVGQDKADLSAYVQGSAYAHAARDISAFSNTAAQGAGSLSLGKGGLDTSLKGAASTFDSIKVGGDKVDLGAFAQGSATVHAASDISGFSNTAAQGAGSISLGEGGLDTSLKGSAATFDSLKVGGSHADVFGALQGSESTHIARDINGFVGGAVQGSGFLNVGKGGVTATGQGSGYLAGALDAGHAGLASSVIGSGSAYVHASPDISNVLSGAAQGSGFLDIGKNGISAAGQGSGYLADTLKIGHGGLTSVISGQGSGSVHVSRDISNILSVAGQGSGFLDVGKNGINAAGQGSGYLADSLKTGHGGLTSVISGQGSGSVHVSRDISNILSGAEHGSDFLDVGKNGLTAMGQGAGYLTDSLKAGKTGLISVVTDEGSGFLHASRDISNVLTGAGQGSGLLNVGKEGTLAAGQGSGYLADTLKAGHGNILTSALGGQGSGLLHVTRDISNVLTEAAQGSELLQVGKDGVTALGQGSGYLADTLKAGHDNILSSTLSGQGSGYIHASRDVSNTLAGAVQGSDLLNVGKNGVMASGQGSGYLVDSLKVGHDNGLTSIIAGSGSGSIGVHATRDIAVGGEGSANAFAGVQVGDELMGAAHISESGAGYAKLTRDLRLNGQELASGEVKAYAQGIKADVGAQESGSFGIHARLYASANGQAKAADEIMFDHNGVFVDSHTSGSGDVMIGRYFPEVVAAGQGSVAAAAAGDLHLGHDGLDVAAAGKAQGSGAVKVGGFFPDVVAAGQGSVLSAGDLSLGHKGLDLSAMEKAQGSGAVKVGPFFPDITAAGQGSVVSAENLSLGNKGLDLSAMGSAEGSGLLSIGRSFPDIAAAGQGSVVSAEGLSLGHKGLDLSTVGNAEGSGLLKIGRSFPNVAAAGQGSVASADDIHVGHDSIAASSAAHGEGSVFIGRHFADIAAVGQGSIATMDDLHLGQNGLDASTMAKGQGSLSLSARHFPEIYAAGQADASSATALSANNHSLDVTDSTRLSGAGKVFLGRTMLDKPLAVLASSEGSLMDKLHLSAEGLSEMVNGQGKGFLGVVGRDIEAVAQGAGSVDGMISTKETDGKVYGAAAGGIKAGL